jgi:dolichol kinase
MCVVSLCGGALCRCYCKADENGYIVTSKSSWFKVNYTRKFQHFAAYAIPLLIKTDVPGWPQLHLVWGDFFTLLGFLVLIKPMRETFPPFMWMFNSLDRPEDRPNVLLWIIGGNILPGLCMIVFFNWLFSGFGADQQQLVMIFVLVAGVGDGLAEPVGIYTGKHKYATRSCTSTEKYTRSYEGSTCVFITTFLFIEAYWWAFPTPFQFWLLMAVLPIVMTIAEATSPHTMDTPLLMGLGGFLIYSTLRWA